MNFSIFFWSPLPPGTWVPRLGWGGLGWVKSLGVKSVVHQRIHALVCKMEYGLVTGTQTKVYRPATKRPIRSAILPRCINCAPITRRQGGA